RCSRRVAGTPVVSGEVASARGAARVVWVHQLSVDRLDEPRLGRVPWQAVGVEPTHQEGTGGVLSLFHGCGLVDDGKDAWRVSEQLLHPALAAVVLVVELGWRAVVHFYTMDVHRVVGGY